MPRRETARLVLRPPDYCDAPAIAEYLNDYDVAKNLATVPHPFTEGDARAFVTRSHEKRALGEGFCFAILEKQHEAFMGVCGLTLADGRYRLGYWLGKPFWNDGIMTEAVKKVVSFAFHDLKAERVWASWFADNPASGRVLEKLGFRTVESYRSACLARGKAVACIRTALTREAFGRKKAPLLQAVGA